MVNHLTLRMAWHDNNWNGKVCQKPEENIYCVGNHSLLSERLARERKLKHEKPEVPIGNIPGYLPPCYWTTNAFSSIDYDIEYKHPFKGIKAKNMKNKLYASSAFTWPFRLSFNHSPKKKKVEGDYPPDLEDRIKHFIEKFEPNESFIFFYLNYDNPISAEDRKYVLVGCALLKEMVLPNRFDLKDLENVRKKNHPRYKNFPLIDWTLPVIYDFKESGIILPYKEYWDRAKEHEEQTEKLENMRVLIEEEDLIPSFKYVANDVDDDKCLYLLYKLKKALSIIREDHIVDISIEEQRIDEFLEKAWSNRGLYPSLGKILDVIGGFDGKSLGKGAEIVNVVKSNLSGDDDLIEYTFKLLSSRKENPSYLKTLKKWITVLKIHLRDYSDDIALLKKLSLFSLTHFQIKRLLHNRKDCFKKTISANKIVENPYLLAEEYIPKPPKDDLDIEELPDPPIGLFSIDIGMQPDPNYIDRNLSIQNLSPASQERIRAITIEYLNHIGEKGDCFSRLEDLYEYICNYPLFYRSDLNISEEKIKEMSGDFRKHFDERIYYENNDTGSYFYLNEVKEAENIVKETIESLVNQKDYIIKIKNLKEFIEQQSKEISETLLDLDKDLFFTERYALLSTILKKHLYVISGRPGSGKTKVVGKIVKELLKRGENIILLAPTGKATLRIAEEVKDSNVIPKTIDRFVYSTDFRKCLESFENLVLLSGDENRLDIQNLIIDECSMVDLQHLAVLFEMLWKRNSNNPHLRVNRVILVGDENQLPPIEFGKPFYDIIDFLKQTGKYQKENYIQLLSNCRQGFDPKILEIAEIYESKNRYFEEKLDLLQKGGKISEGFNVELWTTVDDLKNAIAKRLDILLPVENKDEFISKSKRNTGLNQLWGLYPSGNVKNFDPQKMELDKFQMLSPYRGDQYGTLGLNRHIKEKYRSSTQGWKRYLRRFDHADKIIRTNNWYAWDYELKERTLKLSNGSIGLVCDGKDGRAYYFSDRKRALRSIDDADNFELAYAITVHKAQGSEFENVFLVLPKRQGLLMKELLYTGLTRSKRTLNLFLQETKGKGPLQIAREHSAILSRNTSIFDAPEDIKGKLWPDKKVTVKSKIEFILYKYLDKAQKNKSLDFKYESELLFKNINFTIHPDFTIQVGDRKYYWEHLGILDAKRYYKDWIKRRDNYRENGLIDCLITTDDLEGVKDEKVCRVIEDIIHGKLVETIDSKFSNHHYQLYEQNSNQDTSCSKTSQVQTNILEGLPPENMEMFKEVSVFESKIRSFIFENIKSAGSNLLSNKNIPKQIRENWEKRKADDIKNGKTEEKNTINYADFSDYKEIIYFNWKKIFSKYFKDKDKLRVYLDDLNNLCRKATMHNRTITKNEIGLAKIYIRWLNSRMK